MPTAKLQVLPAAGAITTPTTIEISHFPTCNSLRLILTGSDYRHPFRHETTLDAKGQSHINLSADDVGVLFASMTSEPSGRRFALRDVTKPILWTFRLVMATGEPLAEVTIERTFLKQGITRKVLTMKDDARHTNQEYLPAYGKLRGVLFIPPGPGPFPCVIDMFGSIGGIMDFRAALLAGEGFMVLHLSYLFHEDLPDNMETLQLNYFHDAVEWMLRHPAADSPLGCALVGTSMGGEIAQIVAATNPKVRACCSISGYCVLHERMYTQDGTQLPSISQNVADTKTLPPQHVKHARFDHGGLVLKYATWEWWCEHIPQLRGYYNAANKLPLYATDAPTEVTPEGKELCGYPIMPIENINGPLMLIVGTDDVEFPAPEAGRVALHRMWHKGRGADCYLVELHGAGHLLEPPYKPTNRSSWHPPLQMMLVWGGNPVDQSRGDVKGWESLLWLLKEKFAANKYKRSKL